MILVGDIGGTNSRLALAEPDGATFRFVNEQHYATPADLPALVGRYLHGFAHAPIRAVALCGAGPLREDGSIQLTNSAAVLAPTALAEAAGTPAVHVVNDFAAVAHSLPVLPPHSLRRCGGQQERADAPRVVLGAGTGLGIATLIPSAGDWVVVPGEGGHTDLAVVDDDELVAWQRMRTTLPRLTAEHVLSGAGLSRLYAACGGAEATPPPKVAAAAAAGDAVASQAIRLFTGWLGRIAGNMALTVLARGGVYIAGGIVPAWGSLFDEAVFRRAFEDKAPFAGLMQQIPVWIITEPTPALLGLARLGAGSLRP